MKDILLLRWPVILHLSKKKNRETRGNAICLNHPQSHPIFRTITTDLDKENRLAEIFLLGVTRQTTDRQRLGEYLKHNHLSWEDVLP